MNYVTYLRVSTREQGDSGLGIEAQRAAIKRWLRDDEAHVTEFREVESGKKTDRAQLNAAIALSKKMKCKLVVAKLDRLARDVLFTATLMKTGVDFVCVDNPDATPLTIHIFAAIAQHERETISTRTKAALDAKKARGETLGKPENLTLEHRAQGVEVIKRNAADSKANRQARNLIAHHPEMTNKQLAAHLNELGYRTRHDKDFYPE
nr:hypothetical protein [Tanacetum cinerariifolium]